MNKKAKTTGIIVVGILVLFFASIFYQNIVTFNRLKNNTGYTYGKIIKVWKSRSTYSSRYLYKVDGKEYTGKQGYHGNLGGKCLVVYDKSHPKFSMIATYKGKYDIENIKISNLDDRHVEFVWFDYLPGDEIKSIKDLWFLD